MKCVVKYWEVYRITNDLARELTKEGWQYTSKKEWKDAGRNTKEINNEKSSRKS